MKTKAKQEELVEILRRWQHVENRSVAASTAIIDQTRNPVIQMVMEIIQRDSAMHHRVQQFIIDSLEREAIELTVEDLAQVWGAIEGHIEAERETAALVAAARKSLAGTKNPVQQFLLEYLAQDEGTHDRLLEDLSLIKRGMYRSA
jgi:hypothetical protein